MLLCIMTQSNEKKFLFLFSTRLTLVMSRRVSTPVDDMVYQ